MKEKWKDIPGYGGKYLISNLGNVKSLNFNNSGEVKNLSPIIRKGYLYVNLSQLNKVRKFNIHRLVASAFIPNPKSHLYVNHIDGVKLNNKSENLEWVSLKENERHAVLNGLKAKGERHGMSKLTQNEVSQIRHLAKLGQFRRSYLAEKYKVTTEMIGRIINNKNWVL